MAKFVSSQRGERHHSAKLTEAKVRAIRRLYDSGKYCTSCLSKIYGVTGSTIWDIVNYNTWVHVRTHARKGQRPASGGV